ncbi:hypothetical protein [Pseudomonas sp. MWU12-3103b]|uniref:hypothetical protein n=1 Tax=Pseudomonas sp. MWU12-3103b TaxID=2928857 RepID=UPI00200021D5|nr:hypothetical protein [Pseudomonas sp. MWU12-3103b]
MDQDEKKNIRMEKPNSEMSELNQEERNLLTRYRAMSDQDRGYIQHFVDVLTSASAQA